MRLDLWLKNKYPEQSRAYWQRKIHNGEVFVDSRKVKRPHDEIREDALVTIQSASAQPLPKRAKGKLPFEILFEDSFLLIIEKPVGIAVHQPFPSRTILEELEGNFDFIKPVHRLDRDTTGILVFAKSENAHAALCKLWKDRKVKKEYVALVKGVFDSPQGVIDAPIARSMKNRQKMAVSEARNARPSHTEFKVIFVFGDASFVRVFPKTGRTHQIRVHFASIGHPVIGDALYGDKKLNAKFAKLGLLRQFLHASALSFRHPFVKKNFRLSSHLPPDLENCLKQLR